ncbi:RNA-binding protein, partial [Arthrobacter nitrophenolicus]
MSTPDPGGQDLLLDLVTGTGTLGESLTRLVTASAQAVVRTAGLRIECGVIVHQPRSRPPSQALRRRLSGCSTGSTGKRRDPCARCSPAASPWQSSSATATSAGRVTATSCSRPVSAASWACGCRSAVRHLRRGRRTAALQSAPSQGVRTGAPAPGPGKTGPPLWHSSPRMRRPSRCRSSRKPARSRGWRPRACRWPSTCIPPAPWPRTCVPPWTAAPPSTLPAASSWRRTDARTTKPFPSSPRPPATGTSRCAGSRRTSWSGCRRAPRAPTSVTDRTPRPAPTAQEFLSRYGGFRG